MKTTICLPILGLLLVCGCGEKEVKKNKTEKFCISAELKQKIEIQEVKNRVVSESINLTGNVAYNADNVVQFNSLVEGVITNTYFSLGDYVKKGQVLAEIRSTELNTMQAESKSLESQLLVAQRELQSTQSMFDDGIASQRDMIQAQSEVDVIKSSLEGIKANLDLFSASNEKSVFRIKAPTEGYIVAKNISSGMQISETGEALFTISNLKKVWVMVNIYTTNLRSIKEGMPVDIVIPSYPDEVFKGKITSLSNVFDAEEHVLKARVEMDNPELKLKPGMLADISIDNNEQAKEMASLPTEAVIFDNNKNYILVYKSDCDIEVREIAPTVKTNNWLYFEDNVTVGEKIITKNHLLIHENLKD